MSLRLGAGMRRCVCLRSPENESIACGFVNTESLLCRLPGDAKGEPNGRPRMASLSCIGYVPPKHQLCELRILVGLDDVADFLVPLGEPLTHSVKVTLTLATPPEGAPIVGLGSHIGVKSSRLLAGVSTRGSSVLCIRLKEATP